MKNRSQLSLVVVVASLSLMACPAKKQEPWAASWNGYCGLVKQAKVSIATALAEIGPALEASAVETANDADADADAGVVMDAGTAVRTDAGVATDGGTAADAGVAADAGFTLTEAQQSACYEVARKLTVVSSELSEMAGVSRILSEGWKKAHPDAEDVPPVFAITDELSQALGAVSMGCGQNLAEHKAALEDASQLVAKDVDAARTACVAFTQRHRLPNAVPAD